MNAIPITETTDMFRITTNLRGTANRSTQGTTAAAQPIKCTACTMLTRNGTYDDRVSVWPNSAQGHGRQDTIGGTRRSEDTQMYDKSSYNT